jgi:hypothetical protein
LTIIVDFIRGGETERLWGEGYYAPGEFKSMLELSVFKQTEEDFLYEDAIFIHCFSFSAQVLFLR